MTSQLQIDRDFNNTVGGCISARFRDRGGWTRRRGNDVPRKEVMGRLLTI